MTLMCLNIQLMACKDFSETTFEGLCPEVLQQGLGPEPQASF